MTEEHRPPAKWRNGPCWGYRCGCPMLDTVEADRDHCVRCGHWWKRHCYPEEVPA